ncbi:uncharacterized protein A4U43_UnF1020 [Asparagus officinalis]|uniref:Cyclin n=1 Tax=Asparagus officinalis TaxID=4686 RepID=A0A1R3L7L4_ASPOF|nr:cyclin-P4-1 [Asparagus officinalis]ONK55604.1 uncharacterized protein A4U43_UnF1020 [Asparagus officinalis]
MSKLIEDPYGVPRIVSILSSLLQRVADRNDATRPGLLRPTTACSAFQGLSKPSISVRGYLERIFRYANCSPSCYVVAYIYLDRFLHRNPAVSIDSFNVHRFIITSVLAAVKFMDDIYYNNTYFAKVGGISLMEMNYLEVDFLFGVGFELNVTPVTFNSYCSILQKEIYASDLSQAPPRAILCSLSEDEPSSCQQQQQQTQQLAVREVFGT